VFENRRNFAIDYQIKSEETYRLLVDYNRYLDRNYCGLYILHT
jgi:hypothetical protein